MQSSDYVPGVSGWKMHKDGRLEVEGVVRVLVSRAAEEEPVAPTESDLNALGLNKADFAKPFIVVDGVTYINEAEVERSAIKQKVSGNWLVQIQLRDGKYVAAGIGLGMGSHFLVDADRFVIKSPTEIEKALATGDMTKVLDLLAGKISESDLAKDIVSPIADQVREVIRAEKRAGGLLHRN